MVGQAGLELQYNRQLMGKDGLRRIIVNSRGVEVTEAERVAPADGPTAILTLDLDLQKAFEEAMAGQSGSVIALDPETGDILAYLSLPGYDPNAFSAGINDSDLGGPQDRPREAPHQPRDPGQSTRRAARSRSSTPWPRCRRVSSPPRRASTAPATSRCTGRCSAATRRAGTARST